MLEKVRKAPAKTSTKNAVSAFVGVIKHAVAGTLESIREYASADAPENLSKKSGLKAVDRFANTHFKTVPTVIAIGGEKRSEAFYPSETIAQMALWALRKQGSGLPLTVSLNLAPAFWANGMPEGEFHSELDQKRRILRNVRLLWATDEEANLLQFELSTSTKRDQELLSAAVSGSARGFVELEALLSARESDARFRQDLLRCVPKGAKEPDGDGNLDTPGTEAYALYEICKIIGFYQNGQRIKIGHERELLYDQIFKNLLDGEYPSLVSVTEKLNPSKPGEPRKPSSEIWGTAYWNARADENAARLLENRLIERFLRIGRIVIPVVTLSLLAGGAWYKKQSEETELAAERARMTELYERSRTVQAILDGVAKRRSLEYEQVVTTTIDWMVFRGKDALEISILTKSEHVAYALISYRQKKTLGEGRYNASVIEMAEATALSIRGLAPAIEQILRQERYTLEKMKYVFQIGATVEELEKDPKFLSLFQTFVWEPYEPTPEYRKRVFEYLGN